MPVKMSGLPVGLPLGQAPTSTIRRQSFVAQLRKRAVKSHERRALKVRAAAATETPTAPKEGPTLLFGQVAHSITKEKLELVNGMTQYVEDVVLPLLKPVDKCWQPADFLPDSSSPDFLDEVKELRKRTDLLPDDYFVVLTGDMITEEALPTYMAMLNTLDGVRDETGACPTPWGRWTREWTAEENRHGDVMNKYMYLSGRVNMRAVEKTIQNLIGTGMDPKTENNPYLGFVYTSFQERATKISHGNTARHALEYGDDVLSKLCGGVAADESRHEIAYTKIVDELFRLDPSGATLAFADMMKKQIVMPAHMMNDNEHGTKQPGRNLFADFSAVAEYTKTYTALDYADIMDHLVQRWDLGHQTGLSAEAAEAQEYVCKLPQRIRTLAERTYVRRAKAKKSPVKFSWVYDKAIDI